MTRTALGAVAIGASLALWAATAWAQASLSHPLPAVSSLRPARTITVSPRQKTGDGKCSVSAPAAWYVSTKPDSMHFSPPVPTNLGPGVSAPLIIESQPAANYAGAMQTDIQKGQALPQGKFKIIINGPDHFLAQAGPNPSGFTAFYAEAKSATTLCHAWWFFNSVPSASVTPDPVGLLMTITPAP